METQEEAAERRSMNWHFHLKDKKCKNCQWASFNKGDDIIVCGHHIANFTITSSCDKWTYPKDSFLIKNRKKLKAKYLNK